MEKTPRPNRIREALGQLHDQQPPYFREYLRRFQEDPTSRVFAPLAEAYRRLGRFEEAVAICLEGLEHHPDFHGGRVVLAKCYLAMHKVQEAKVELERVVHAVPENLLGQRLLGDAHLSMNNKAAALHCYKMALLLSPTDVTLAEKVHGLESGASAFLAEAPLQEPVDILPPSKEEIEGDIPPLWTAEVPEPGLITPDDLVEPSVLGSPGVPMGLQALTNDDDNPIDDEGFKVEHVSTVFDDAAASSKNEITTETLGDLYFSQGQFDKALRIFEKLKPTVALQKKTQACRQRLGVDLSGMVRNRKIALLKAIVDRSRE